jgi:hypothetical protein
MENHAGAAIHDPAPDERTEQNVLEQPTEDTVVDHGVDHIGGLVGNR